MQDLWSQKQQYDQRQSLKLQAEENAFYTLQKNKIAIEKSYRKWQQAQTLIEVAQKAVTYRKEELKTEKDRLEVGMSTPTNVLKVEAELAKAEADALGAWVSLKLAEAELMQLSQ